MGGVVKIETMKVLPENESLVPVNMSYPVILSAPAGSSKIRVWADDSRDGNGWAKCTDLEITLVIVKVEVDAASVPETPNVPPEEDSEYNPGGFISVNNDDDDDDLVVDYDDTSVTGEDNLIRIDLNVWPDTEVGMVRVVLNTPTGESSLWTGSNKGFKMIPFGGVWYYRDWDPGVLPSSLYAEAKGTSGMTLSIFYLTANGYQLFQKDMVTLKAAKLETYVDSSYTTPLNDYCRTSTHPRSPMYMFGKQDPIYVEVGNYDNNDVAQKVRERAVKVTSESGGMRTLDMQETSCSSGKFHNILDLHLDEVNGSDGSGEHVRVDDEEVLTFWVKIQPDSGSYVSCKRVMVDRAEAGVEYQCTYGCSHPVGSGTIYFDQNQSYNFGFTFYDYLLSEGDWYCNFLNVNRDSVPSHWRGGITNTVDLATWSGHSWQRGGYFHFNLGGGVCEDLKKNSCEIDVGSTDADWVVFNTCYSLDDSDSELKDYLVKEGRNAHLFLGFVTECHWENEDMGQYFAERLHAAESIKQAWFDFCDRKQPAGTIVRVFGADYCMNDSLSGSWPRQVSRDPTNADNWVSDE